MAQGRLLELLTWKQAEEALKEDSIAVIPLGAACKEHGYHLQLRNDWLMAEYLKQQVLEHVDAIILPTVNYSFYPAFVEYPGSVSLSSETSSNMIVEICRSISAFGPRRFYVLNTGISTIPPLKKAASDLAPDKIVLKFLELNAPELQAIDNEVSEQEGGSHADEIETSMMLVMAPETVEMEKASKDYQINGKGRLSRKENSGFCYSPSGVWGDATLATRAKGEKVVKCLVEHVIRDIENLRATPIT